jgi:subtilisin family serine protease
VRKVLLVALARAGGGSPRPARQRGPNRSGGDGRRAGRRQERLQVPGRVPDQEPFADKQWDMRMIDAAPSGSYRVSQGRSGVLVGIIDVAGLVAAGLNGLGTAGVAPKMTLVNIRGGQDAGFLFLQPVVDAIVYAGLVGIDVINLSFYIDPWLFNCLDNRADSPEAQAEQRTVRVATQRAISFAVDLSPRPQPQEGRLLQLRDRADRPLGPRRLLPRLLRHRPVHAGGEHQPVDHADGPGRGGAEADPDDPFVLKDCKGSTCGYYQYLQGTSMAAPHATGVAALIVSTHGRRDPAHGGLTMSPGAVQRVLTRTAKQTPCPFRPCSPTPTAIRATTPSARATWPGTASTAGASSTP